MPGSRVYVTPACYDDIFAAGNGEDEGTLDNVGVLGNRTARASGRAPEEGAGGEGDIA